MPAIAAVPMQTQGEPVSLCDIRAAHAAVPGSARTRPHTLHVTGRATTAYPKQPTPPGCAAQPRRPRAPRPRSPARRGRARLSRSLNARMDVLYTLTARSAPPAPVAWYTLASLPVLTQPLISPRKPLFSILNSTWRARGSGPITATLPSVSILPGAPRAAPGARGARARGGRARGRSRTASHGRHDRRPQQAVRLAHVRSKAIPSICNMPPSVAARHMCPASTAPAYAWLRLLSTERQHSHKSP